MDTTKVLRCLFSITVLIVGMMDFWSTNFMKLTFSLCSDLIHFSNELIEPFYSSEYKRIFITIEPLFIVNGRIYYCSFGFEILLNEVILRIDIVKTWWISFEEK